MLLLVPMRKGYRPYRNRAIVNTLIETGMRRAAVRNLNLKDVDFKKRNVGTMLSPFLIKFWFKVIRTPYPARPELKIED